MLSWLRAKKGSVFFKVIVFAIVFSMLFGFGNIFNRNFRREIVMLSIGGENVSEVDYLDALGKRVGYVSRTDLDFHSERGRELSVIVLVDIVKDRLLAREVEKLGLIVPDSVVRSVVRGAFFNETLGFFDRESFDAQRARLRMTEAAYLNFLREQLQREQLLLTIGSALAELPEVLVETWYDYMNAEHIVSYVTIGNERLVAGDLAADEEVLRRFYEDHLELFTQPEARHFVYFSLPRGDKTGREYNKVINDLELASTEEGVTIEELAATFGRTVSYGEWTRADLQDTGQDLHPIAQYVYSLSEQEVAKGKLRLTSNQDKNIYWLVKPEAVVTHKISRYEDVRDQVAEQWRASNTKQMAHQKALQLAGRATTGRQLEAVTSDFATVTNLVLQRDDEQVLADEDALRDFLLDLAVGETQVLEQPDQQTIAIKTVITRPATRNARLLAEYRSRLLGGWRSEVRETFILGLLRNADIKLNEENLSKYLQPDDIVKLKDRLQTSRQD